MDQGWIKSGHIRGDELRPILGSGMAIGGRHRVPKWLQKAINGPFVAISRSGSSKLVDQHVSRFDQVRKHPGDVLDPFPGSRMVNGGRHRTQKWSKNVINGHFVAISRSGGSEWPFRTRE